MLDFLQQLICFIKHVPLRLLYEFKLVVSSAIELVEWNRNRVEPLLLRATASVLTGGSLAYTAKAF